MNAAQSVDDPRMLDMFEKYPALRDVYCDTSLTPHARKLRLAPLLRQVDKDIKSFRRDAAEKTKQLNYLSSMVEEYETGDFDRWRKGNATLEKNDHSRLHMLMDAMALDRVLVDDGNPLSASPEGDKWSRDLSQYHTFVVQHDWAQAFNGAADYSEGASRLPFEHCVFEFRISGKTVLVFARQIEGEPIHCFPFVQLKTCWTVASDHIVLGESEPQEGFYRLAIRQVRAVCIALDAEVATHSVVRAPHKLNVKREREGKVPLFDYRVVSLSRRARAQGMPRSAPGLSPTRKRLHFRRGHWRHFAEFKTWVRWTLVGNPELGFIDHEYRL